MGIAALLLLLAALPSHAQGVLTLTPGRTLATTAGTGSSGLSGDGTAATAAQLARPSGVAYDAAGDLFLADANNHVIREITLAGIITTFAGSGTAGFGGDGGPATAAFLDTPTGVAVDPSGILYIADSHNHRIRMVSNGTISTLAGTGTSGFSGDGGPALSAQLALPSAVALDTGGDVYIADTNNQRIRKLSAGTITTVAGNGEELFAGDGGPATAASLDQPTGIAIDATGNLYIADKNNQRIRQVTAAGVISTLAGNGTGAFAGSFGGDGGAAASASLAKPVSLSLDVAGNLFVADTNNQRIRQISANGTIATVAGTGDQGFAGDGGSATSAILNSPRGLATDPTGNFSIADTRNQRIRAVALPQLAFGTQTIGTASTPQSLTLSNTGSAPLTISTLTFSGPFSASIGESCTALPLTLIPGASCTESIAFQPIANGQASGSVTVTGQGLPTQSVLLIGSGAPPAILPTTLLLAADKASALSGEAVTFSATLTTSEGSTASASGSVSFYAGRQLLGTGPLTLGKATFTTSTLPDGTQSLSAVYTGAPGFAASTAAALSEHIADISLALNAPQTPTVEPGHTAAVPFSLAALDTSGLTGNIALATGPLPAGLTVTFAPATVPLSNGQLPFTMSVTAAPTGATATANAASLAGSGIALACLFFPLCRKKPLKGMMRSRPLVLFLLSLASLGSLAALSGCGGSTGFFGQPQKTYSLTVIATATDATGGTLTRSTPVSILVQ